MDYFQVFLAVLGISAIACSIVILLILIEIFKVIKNFRLVSDRLEMLTDVPGWFTFFKVILGKKNKKVKSNK